MMKKKHEIGVTEKSVPREGSGRRREDAKGAR